MIKAPIGPNENKRQAALEDLDILNSTVEKAYDDMTELASFICEAPVSMISLIDGDRQWFKSKQGIDQDESPREISFCGHAIHQSEVFEVPDADKDKRFHDNPFVNSGPMVKFYAGYPIAIDGENVGTLCVLDLKPRELTAAQKKALETLGNAVASMLNLRRAARDMAVVSDNVPTGLIAFDGEMKVFGGYSKSCQTIFGADLGVGQDLARLMFDDNNSILTMQLGVEQVFGDFLPDHVTLSQLPRRFSKNERDFEVSYSVIRSSQNEVTKILASIDDITDLIVAQNEAAAQQALLQIAADKQRFGFLMADYAGDIAKARAAINAADGATVRNVLHTFKGNFLSFGLAELGSTVHAIEGQDEITTTDLDAIDVLLQELLGKLNDVLGISFDDSKTSVYEVSADYLEKLENFLSSRISSREEQTFIRDWVSEMKSCPLKSLTSHLQERAVNLGKKMDKQINFEVVDHDLKVDPRPIKDVLKNLIHAVNNAVDHGIEEPYARGDKPENGTIRISFAAENDQLVIVIEDDGRGIDPVKMRELAVTKQLMSSEKAQQLTDQQAVELVLLSDFSSKSEVSEISGRGVGMSALMDAVRDLGGSLQIDSKVNVGTTTTIKVETYVSTLQESEKAA